MMRLILSIVLSGLMTASAYAEVIKSSADGFIIQHTLTLQQEKTHVFTNMTAGLGKWWDPEHSFSGNAANMRIDSDCFCERWDNNVVVHLNTSIWIEGSKVVMEGGLGPLKELGLNGSMVWSLTSTEGGGTNLTWKYFVRGFSDTDLISLAPVVDGMLKEQLGRLSSFLN